jgi:hypothetical protein
MRKICSDNRDHLCRVSRINLTKSGIGYNNLMRIPYLARSPPESSTLRSKCLLDAFPAGMGRRLARRPIRHLAPARPGRAGKAERDRWDIACRDFGDEISSGGQQTLICQVRS